MDKFFIIYWSRKGHLGQVRYRIIFCLFKFFIGCASDRGVISFGVVVVDELFHFSGGFVDGDEVVFL